MNSQDFPALYRSASLSSAEAQRQYYLLIGMQYGLLFLAAVAALGFEYSSWFSAGYALILLLSTGFLVFTAFVKPEKDWYGARALTESIKTTSWRYMMNAQPFERSVSAIDARTTLMGLLKEILEANTYAKDAVKRRPVDGQQITPAMDAVREKSLRERMDFYLANRILSQRTWYVTKAKANKRHFLSFVILGVVIQSGAVILALLRFKSETLLSVWPTEPMLVLASAVVGWTQIKKFNELASAYSLTAHEIGLVEARLPTVTTEKEWSEFVNEAELAFSREHTQWVARQDS